MPKLQQQTASGTFSQHSDWDNKWIYWWSKKEGRKVVAHAKKPQKDYENNLL